MAEKQGVDARQCAANILYFIIRDKISLDDAFVVKEIKCDWEKLSEKDRGFCYHIVMASLRHFYDLVYFLHYFSAKKNLLSPKNQFVTAVLVNTTAEICLLKVPAYASINTALKIVGFAGKKGQAQRKFANAILRKVATHCDDFTPSPEQALQGHWLKNKLAHQYGEKMAHEICASIYRKPPLDIHFKSADAKKEFQQEIGEDNIIFSEGNFLRLTHHSGAIENLPNYDKGSWWVQDWAAMQAVKLLHPQKGENLLDACAAPGGKTAQMMHFCDGINVTALDKSRARLNRLRENMRRLSLAPTIIKGDILQYKLNDERPYDAILLDAPCSATGTLRKNPEIFIIKEREQIKELKKIQLDILTHCYRHLLKEKGRILYAVCSLLMDEGENVIDIFLQQNPSARIIPPPKTMDKNVQISDNGSCRTFPHIFADKGGMDGFFFVLIEKIS